MSNVQVSHIYVYLGQNSLTKYSRTKIRVSTKYHEHIYILYMYTWAKQKMCIYTHRPHQNAPAPKKANCIWSVIQSYPPITISLVSFQRNVVKET